MTIKVVMKNTRMSIISRNMIPEEMLKLKDIIKVYEKDAVITADIRTPGILVFDTEKYAKEFLSRYDDQQQFMLLTVEPIGKKTIIIILLSDIILPKAYNQPNKLTWNQISGSAPYPLIAPPGTIAYPAVKVLE